MIDQHDKRARLANALREANEAMVTFYLEAPAEYLDAIQPIQTGILTLMRQIEEED